LITLSILLVACVAAALSGLIDRRTLVELVSDCKREACACLSTLTGLVRGVKSKDLVGQFKRSDSFDDFISRISHGTEPDPPGHSVDLYAPLDMDILNCRVLTIERKEGNSVCDAFGVEICGSIHAPSDMRHATLRISILDVTDGASGEPVLAGSRQGASLGQSDAPEFSYLAELGRLPSDVTKLDDWTVVASLRTDGQVFSRRGRRMLQFSTSIQSTDGGRELAVARCNFVYENPLPGYLDLRENAERTKVLTVALGFAVSAADNKLYECEIELIKRWAFENIPGSQALESGQSEADLEKALSKTVAFFSEGKRLDTFKLSQEMVEIATIGQCYEVLDLCLHVAKASGSVTAEEMAMLKDLASWLEVDAARFRAMMEKILPIEMHEVMDINDVLGITSDMSRDKTRRHLNKEYSKWNSRVTSENPSIQTQADQMLKLIAEARGQYVADNSRLKVGADRP